MERFRSIIIGLGYTKDENGYLIIDEEQAMVVRRIFREYLQGARLKI